MTICKSKLGGVTPAPPIAMRKNTLCPRRRTPPVSPKPVCYQAAACKRRFGGVATISGMKNRRVEVGSSSSRGGQEEAALFGLVGKTGSAHRLRHPVPLSNVGIASGCCGVPRGRRNKAVTGWIDMDDKSALSG